MLEIFKQFVNVFCYCAGGNQRELARAKNLKKTQDKAKKSDDGLSAAARKQRDAQIMQEKQKKATEKKDEPK